MQRFERKMFGSGGSRFAALEVRGFRLFLGMLGV